MKVRIGVFSVLVGITVLAVTVPGLFAEERVHVVQRGETFFSIAHAEGVSSEALMKHNGITDPTRLQAGQRLKIPGGAPASATVSTPVQAPVSALHRVTRGDTLFSIAKRFSVTVDSLRRVNNLAEGRVLREGEILRLPPEAVLPAGTSVQAPAKAPPVPTPAPTPQLQPAAIRGEPSGAANAQMRWPIPAREISYMTGGALSGVVITGARSEPVKSLTSGTVLSAGPYRGFGMVAIIQVEGGYIYVYGGCESLSVREGDRVIPGTELGRLGVDAGTNKPTLFFMVYRNNVQIDPAKAPRG